MGCFQNLVHNSQISLHFLNFFPWIFKENLVSFKLELLSTTSKLGCALKIETVCVQKIVISYKIFFRTSCHFYATQLLMFAQNVYSSGIKKALHIWSPLLWTLTSKWHCQPNFWWNFYMLLKICCRWLPVFIL